MSETDPIFQTHDERLRAILGNQPGTFGFDSQTPYPGHTAYPNPPYSLDLVGDNAVSVNLSDIASAAEEFGIDQNLVEAVVYMENAHGWYDVIKPGNATARPGNINAEIWAELLDVDPELVHSDSTINIRLTAKILSEIQERLVDPTPAAIATLYNSLYADQISGYGLTIEKYMELRPWESPGALQKFLEVIGQGMLGPSPGGHFMQCFLSDTLIQMWPLDASMQPRADGTYDEELVLSQVWEKPISEITPGDLVVSYDDKGRIRPGPVVSTMENQATHILDFWGTGTTPGHAYFCAGGRFKGQHVPLMDILRTDGAIMRADGTLVRATTNCEVDSMGDRMIHASASLQKRDGSWTKPKPGKVRFGTRIILPDGRHTSFMEMAASEGWRVSDDGYMIGMMEGEDGTPQEQKFLFPYAHGEDLPKPEDYILSRSDVTLEAIYAAGEWEQISTRMPAPDGMAGLNTNHTSTLLQPSKPEPNIPPAFASHPDVPCRSKDLPINRKQRKAMETKQRKAAKAKVLH